MRPADREGWKIISITAHRELRGSDRARIQSVMRLLVQKPSIDAIYFGGARGGDTQALLTAAEHRVGIRPRLVVVCPDTAAAQPLSARQWFHLADEIVELKNTITKDDNYQAYRTRNEYLVDACTSLVGFFNGKKDTGTGHAIAYAKSCGVVVYEIPIGR